MKGQVVAGTVRVAVDGVGPARQVETVVVKPRGQGKVATEGTTEGLIPGYEAVTTYTCWVREPMLLKFWYVVW